MYTGAAAAPRAPQKIVAPRHRRAAPVTRTISRPPSQVFDCSSTSFGGARVSHESLGMRRRHRLRGASGRGDGGRKVAIYAVLLDDLELSVATSCVETFAREMVCLIPVQVGKENGGECEAARERCDGKAYRAAR